MTKEQSNRGGKRSNSGRKPSGKVRLQCWVNPETKAALGSKPGIKIDEIMREQSAQTPQPPRD
jgi:hypothetical protein